MAALGRILQVLGWLWVIAGVVGSFFDFGGFSVFPGIILLFVSRVIRRQAPSTTVPESTTVPDVVHDGEGERHPVDEPEVPERILNTERQRERPPEQEPVQVTLDVEEPEATGEDLVERILAAGTDIAGSDTPEAEDQTGQKPASSAEMIARAHDRWGSRKG